MDSSPLEMPFGFSEELPEWLGLDFDLLRFDRFLTVNAEFFAHQLQNLS